MIDKPELLRLAKFLTGSSDVEELITAAKQLEQYSNASEIATTYQHPTLMSVQANIVDFASTLSVFHPTRGAIPFAVYDYQRQALTTLQDSNVKTIAIASSRQMGWTTLLAAHALHFALNNDDTVQLMMTPRFSGGREFIQLVEYMTRSRPDVCVRSHSADSIEFGNGSKIIARAALATAPRGTTLHKAIIMDAAYVSHKTLEELLTSLAPALATGAQMIMQSTPKMADDPFHKFCKSAELFIHQPWDLHPGRDEAWKQHTVSSIGEESFRRQYDAEFISDASDQ